MSSAQRRRSRSRSPINSSRLSRDKHGTVNMLDAASLELAKNPGPNIKRSAERITCTIPGNRPRLHDRVSGGKFESNDRRVSMRTEYVKSTNTSMNRRERRAALQARITRPNDHERKRDEEDDRKNGSFRDADKPVQRLVDPTFVPKSKAFFDHDDRAGADKWRGRTTYDPRIDFGPRHNRNRSNWDGFGDRRNDRGRRDDRRRHSYGDRRESYGDRRESFGDRRESYGDRRESFGDRREERNSFYNRSSGSGADGLWTHDKFVEFDDEAEDKTEEKIVVANAKSSRKIDEN